jgi:hypothetical protein
MLLSRLHNLELALSVVLKNQTNQKSSVWAQLEKEVVDLQSRIEETKCQIKRNSAET